MRSIAVSCLQCQRQLCLTNSFILSLIYRHIHVFPPCVLFYGACCCCCCVFVLLTFVTFCAPFIYSFPHSFMHAWHSWHSAYSASRTRTYFKHRTVNIQRVSFPVCGAKIVRCSKRLLPYSCGWHLKQCVCLNVSIGVNFFC